MAKVQVNVDFGGPARAGQTVSVFQAGTQTPVTVYAQNGTTVLSPVKVQPNGHVYFLVDPGTYDVVGPDLTRTVTAGTTGGLPYMELASSWPSGNVAAGNADIDIPGLVIAFTPGVRPFRVSLDGKFQFGLGTAASPSVIRVQPKIKMSTDGGATWTPVEDLATATAKVATGEGHYGLLACRSGLIAPSAAAYQFKASVAINITGANVTVFGRNLGATTSLEAVERL